MGKKAGVAAIILGVALWYYGGTSNGTKFVNLGIASIILGLVITTLRGMDVREIERLTHAHVPEFIDNLRRNMKLTGDPILIPPYPNLPRGGVFLPKSKNPSIKLGMLSENELIVKGSSRESGLLLSPPPGWELLKYFEEHSGSVEGSGASYAASVASSGLSALGLGKVAVFESDDGELEIYAEPLIDGPVYTDPVCSATLLAIARGLNSVISIEESKVADGKGKKVWSKNRKVKIKVRKLGTVKELL